MYNKIYDKIIIFYQYYQRITHTHIFIIAHFVQRTILHSNEKSFERIRLTISNNSPDTCTPARETGRVKRTDVLTMGHWRRFTRIHAPLQTTREIVTRTRRITCTHARMVNDVAGLMNAPKIYIEQAAGYKRLDEISNLDWIKYVARGV